MKRILSVLIVLSMIMSFMGIYASAQELVFEESFENGLADWKYNNDMSKTSVVIDSANATVGKNSVKIVDESDSASPAITSKEFAVTEGAEYKATADFKVIDNPVNKVYIRFLDAGGKNLQSTSFYGKSTDWTSASLTVTAPKGAVNAVILVSGVSTGVGGTYVDNIKVVKTDTKPIEPAKDVKEGEIVFAESFENGLEGWSLNDYAKDNTSVTTDKASDGKASLYLSDSSKDDTPGLTKYIAVKPGSYTISVDVLTLEGSNPRVYCYFLDENKKSLHYKSVGKASSDWATASITEIAPEGTAYLQLRIGGVSSGEGKGYIDNIKVVAGGDKGVSASTDIMAITNQINNAKPGDVIEIPDGVYNDVNIRFYANGEEGKPITLKAKNPGKAVITGNSTLYGKGNYLVVDGILFEKCTGKYIFQFEASSSHCLLTNSAFLNCDPTDLSTNQKWAILKGTYNTISKCYFRGKTAQGQMAEIIRSSADPDYHLIENCYFGDFKESSLNGYETVRIGTSTQSLSGSYSTLKGCFFEQCDGEVETVSVKSCNNFILNNTLYNTKGAIVLRHGNETVVSGNLVIGGNPTGRITGIRVIGENHKVFNNYVYNTPSNSQALYVSNGNPNPLIHEYLPTLNTDVHNNTFVNVDTAIVAGEYSPSADNASNRIIPPTGKIYNNYVVSYKGSKPAITGDTNANEITFENNFVNGKKIGYEGSLPSGISDGFVNYTIENGFVVPENGLGADITDVSKAPKNPFEVMPAWVKRDYYDTGKIKFNMVENDPFNNPATSPADLLPELGKINVFLNGERMSFDVEPQLINARTMVPMRAIFEAFNAEVKWDEATFSATATVYPTTVKITENSDIAYINDKEIKLDSPAVIINGRFLVPLRFVSEAFGAGVEWVDSTQTVLISYENDILVKEFKPLHDIEGALSVFGLIQSGDDGSNKIEYIFDGNIGTKWAVKPVDDSTDGYGVMDLGSVKTLDKLHIAFQAHDTRIYSYSIFVSEDGVDYKPVLEKISTTVKDGSFEIQDLKGEKAKYIKYVAHGNNQNAWSNITEFVITGK